MLEEWAAQYWDNLERAEAERQYLSRYSDGRLYINASPGYMFTRFDNPYRREDLARAWAYCPIDRQTRRQRLYWLQNEVWETGIYYGCRVIVFIKFKSNNEIVRLRLYRLDGKRFGVYFAQGDDFIDLDGEGNQIKIVDPLPGALDVDKETFWRGFDYMHAHGGLTPEQVKAAQQKRKHQQKRTSV